jgi:hypothetical protein
MSCKSNGRLLHTTFAVPTTLCTITSASSSTFAAPPPHCSLYASISLVMFERPRPALRRPPPPAHSNHSQRTPTTADFA